ncbi:MAG: DUF4261 domain-containing protein [Candidatus Sumerlaeia bacterium]|nr:DUF4261 domain-containing protein [Candidatus Sumerlaeia bacterium]
MNQIEREGIEQEAILCIPGPWKDRTEFVQRVATHTKGLFMFAGAILANARAKDHVPLDFCGAYDGMRHAFEIAGQGQLPGDILDQIASHKSVAYMRFPLDAIGQRERMLKYSSLLRDLGGFAVRVESTGIAHTWEAWHELVSSENPFDQYRCFVILIWDDTLYYSCGMHHFGLPDCQISREIPIEEAADTMNRFNYYQIVGKPTLESGHTFSMTPDSPSYRLTLVADFRHEAGDFFRNPNGLWTIERVEQAG